MSRDRGTARQKQDYGYGAVCDLHGEVLVGFVMSLANQEHGIVSRAGNADEMIAERLPIGTRLRILPNHACATGAQHACYHVLGRDGTTQTWTRFNGW
jgi:threo-3-hydroxy-D-aspartate ammonia-lyase